MVKYIKHYKELYFNLDLFDKTQPVMFDTETLGLYGETRLIQLHQNYFTLIIDCFHVDIKKFRQELESFHLVAHNILYDFNCPDFHGFVCKDFDDTMYMAKLLRPEWTTFNLKDCLLRIGEPEKGEEGASDWSLEELTQEQIDYAVYDVVALQKLYNRLINIKQSSSYKLDMKSIRLALKYSRVGLKVNKLNRLKAMTASIENREKALSTLPTDLNINSPKQVRNFLGAPNSTNATLTDMYLLEKNEIAKAILDARKYDKQLSFLEKKFNADRVYGYFHPSGAKSGRWTCKDQNLQQLPRALKAVFGFSPSEDEWLVDADYSALEIYCACAYVGERTMYKMLKEGVDLHTYSASKIFKVPMEDVTKYQRQVGKTANFSLLYGASAQTYIAMAKSMAGIVLSIEEATEIRDAWLNTYPDIKRWHKTTKPLYNESDYAIVQTPLGRRVRANGFNDQLNIPVQGMGAECTKLALVYLYEKIPDVVVCLTVHDSITLECENREQAEEYAPILEECMKKSFQQMSQMCKIKDLEIGAEAEIVKTLGG